MSVSHGALNQAELASVEDTRDPDASSIGLVGMYGTIVTIAIIVALMALFYSTENAEIETKIMQSVIPEMKQSELSQKANLSRYRYVDDKKQTVAIPINQAMQLTLTDLNRAAASAPARKK